MLNETSRRSTLSWDEARKEQHRSGDTVKQQQSQQQQPPHRANLAHKIDQDYNLAAFNSAIASMDREQVRRRRKIYNFLFTEAVMSMEPIPGSESRKKKTLFDWRRRSRASSRGALGDYEMGEIGGEMPEIHRGISFQKLLTIIAHYKLIEDDQCLSQVFSVSNFQAQAVSNVFMLTNGFFCQFPGSAICFAIAKRWIVSMRE